MIHSRHHRAIKIVSVSIAFLIVAAGAFSLLTLRDEEGNVHFIRTSVPTIKFVKRIITPIDTIFPFSQLGKEVTMNARTLGRLSKTIFGFYPHWMGDYYHKLPYELLTHIAYFSYEVNPETGAPVQIHQWLTTNLIDEAHQKGAKVILVATCFGAENNRTLLSNPAARQQLIDSLISLVRLRNGDGINIDFEIVPSALSDSLTTFMHDLSGKLKLLLPQSHLSIDIPATDRNEAFDITTLNRICDQIIIMGYDYYYSGSSLAGPVAPLTYDGIWRKEHLISTIESYLKKGALPEKILLGIPFYGYEWETESDSLGSNTTKSGKPRFYSSIRSDELFDQRKSDSHSQSAWISFKHENGYKQIWFDDSTSLSAKYEHVDTTGLGGIALWALGYDGGHEEIWNGIIDAFVRVDKIDFEHPCALENNLFLSRAEGINYKSQLHRVAQTSDNHCLQIDVMDSIHFAKSWFIPIELHNLMVIPRSGVITLRTRGTTIPKDATLFCEIDYKGKIFSTDAQHIFSSNQWIEHRFMIPALIDSNGNSIAESDKHIFITLGKVCIEAPGNSKKARIQLDDITSKAFALPENSFIKSVEQNKKRIAIDCLIDGKEIQSFSLQRYNLSKGYWTDRTHKNINRSQIFDGTISDSLSEAGTFYYRLFATDTKRNSFEIENWTVHNYPEIQCVSVKPFSDSLMVEVYSPKNGSYKISLYDENGYRIHISNEYPFKTGVNILQNKLETLNSSPLSNGVYYLQLTDQHNSSTQKILLNR